MRLESNLGNVLGGIAEKMQRVAESEYKNILRTIATSMNGVMVTRIHEQGVASDGSKIGAYDTKPIYVNPTKSTRSFPVGGKSGKTEFISTGLPHKTKYFEDGYSGFKTAVGKNEIGSVNLNLSGQMQNQLSVIETSDGYGLGWSDSEIYKRAVFFEDAKYKKEIWGLTDEELEQVNLIAGENLLDAIS
jgi:hypothetical protein